MHFTFGNFTICNIQRIPWLGHPCSFISSNVFISYYRHIKYDAAILNVCLAISLITDLHCCISECLKRMYCDLCFIFVKVWIDSQVFVYFHLHSYKRIPFLPEARTLLDWICIKTSLTLKEWFKMEDIYSDTFLIKVSEWLSVSLNEMKWFFQILVQSTVWKNSTTTKRAIAWFKRWSIESILLFGYIFCAHLGTLGVFCIQSVYYW